MPFTYTIDVHHRCIFVRHIPVFAMSEIQESFNAIFDDPKFQSGMNILRDCRGCEMPPEWNYTRLNTIAVSRMRENNKKLGAYRVAWMVDSDLGFALVNQARMALDTPDAKDERRPFRDVREALCWLGLPTDLNVDEYFT